MFSPEDAIAGLDKALAATGQMVKIRRGLKGSPVALVTVTGFVRGYSAEDLVAGSGISQSDSRIILSPTSLAAWPPPFPQEGDWCEMDGEFRSIGPVGIFKMADVVVRIELQVKG